MPAPQAIGYIRVSSEAQAGEKQTSLGDQRAAIERRARELGVVIGEWFEDAGFSGATIDKRPAMRAAIAYCERFRQPKTSQGLVLVLNDSRFGRFADPEEAAHLRVHFKSLGWIVRFCEADNIEDPTMRSLIRAVSSAQASDYLRNLRANSMRGREGTIKQGYWASREPFGYRRAVVYPPASARVLSRQSPKGKGEKIKLTPGPDAEVAIVRECFERYAVRGESLRTIAAWLQTTIHPITASGLRLLLTNHAYVGDIATGMRTQAQRERGDHGYREPAYIIPDCHPPLVSRELFARVRATLTGVCSRAHASDYRVKGLVFCDRCGEAFVGGGGTIDAKGERIRSYVDRGGRDKRCPDPVVATIAAHRLEEAVIEGLSAHLAEQLHPEQIERAMAERFNAGRKSREPDLGKQRDTLMKRRDRLVSAIASGIMLQDEAAGLLAKVRADLAALDRVPVSRDERQMADATLRQLLVAANDFPAMARAATGPELRALLYPWVERMTFTRTTRMLTMMLRPLALVLVPLTFPPKTA